MLIETQLLNSHSQDGDDDSDSDSALHWRESSKGVKPLRSKRVELPLRLLDSACR
jgi:hypothetical protein